MVPSERALVSSYLACEIWSINRSDTRTLDIAWNNAFRKIFNAYWRESVKPLLFYCSCLPVAYVLPMRKIIFWRKMFYSSNIVLHTLAKDCKETTFAIVDIYNINASQVLHLDSYSLKSLFWEHFAKAVKP